MQEGNKKLIFQAILFIVVFAIAFAATKYFLQK